MTALRCGTGPLFALACKMPGKIVVASKRSALKKALDAFDKGPITARPLNGGILKCPSSSEAATASLRARCIWDFNSPPRAATARANQKHRRRLRHALKGMRAALFGNEQPGDLSLHTRGD